MTVKWDNEAVADAVRGPELDRALLDMGWDVARSAAALAPVESGGGARSIRAELVKVNGIPEVRVSWDRAHFYMAFHELGTEEISPRPFLRTAAARYR